MVSIEKWCAFSFRFGVLVSRLSPSESHAVRMSFCYVFDRAKSAPFAMLARFYFSFAIRQQGGGVPHFLPVRAWDVLNKNPRIFSLCAIAYPLSALPHLKAIVE